jgi:hypothetical protein
LPIYENTFTYSFISSIASSWIPVALGKQRLKQGDYYDAVLQAVNRLRQNSDHKKSREVLATSYQMAIDLSGNRCPKSNYQQRKF